MANPVHATCVALGEAVVLLLGASGAGKSDLALRLIDDGARLVADDRVALGVQSGRLVATAPAGLPRALEVRGMGLMPVAMAPSAVIGVPSTWCRGRRSSGFPEPVRWRFHDVSVPRYRLDPFNFLGAGQGAPGRGAGAPRASRWTSGHLGWCRGSHGPSVFLMGSSEAAPSPEAVGARVVIVTGMSGAGKSSALKILEDAGFEAIDNLPVSLLSRLLWRDKSAGARESLAVGLTSAPATFMLMPSP